MIIGAAAGAAGMLVLGTYYFLNKKTDRRRALFCKGAATSIPWLLLSAYMLQSGKVEAASTWTLAAILFYIAADVLLECRFVWGAACFGVGHICMTAGFFMEILAQDMTGIEKVTAGRNGTAAFCVFAAGMWLALRKYLPALKGKGLHVPAVMYVLVLSGMASFAVAAGSNAGGLKGGVAVLGGISFVISDLLLAQNYLGRKRSRRKGAAVLILYYLSVYLFSMRFWM